MPTLSNENSFSGVMTALVSPFDQNGKLDLESYERLLDQQLASGVSGVIVCGTTGESPTLSTDEKDMLLKIAVEKCKNKILVIAGTGSNSTEQTVVASKKACDMGADALLVVTPYYNKPSQAGLEAHFNKVAKAVSRPVLLYNVPGRTGVSLAVGTVKSLSKNPNIKGIKEATGNLELLTQLRNEILPLRGDFSFLSGDDPSFWPFLACGGNGIISVASNVIPETMVSLYQCWIDRQTQEGNLIHEKHFEFLQGLFMEPNPVPVKTIAAWKKMIKSSKTRLPLVELTKESAEKLASIWSRIDSTT